MKSEYQARINRTLDYIDSHLADPMTLEELASVANFSPFHFHRIFRAFTAETLQSFIKRVRLERAATKLAANSKITITEVAFDYGFSSSAIFARAFKERFGMSATEWRKCCKTSNSNNSQIEGNLNQTHGNPGEDIDVKGPYLDHASGKLNWRVLWTSFIGGRKMNASVEVRNLPEMTVVYVRYIGAYKGDSALFEKLFGRLCQWAGPRGLIRPPETKFLSIYHDDPAITDETKLRLSVGCTAPTNIEVEGDIGKMTLSGGQYAVAQFEIDPDQYEEAWTAVYKGWLPNSGWLPADGPSFELYLGDPKDHPEGKHTFQICIPVKPL